MWEDTDYICSKIDRELEQLKKDLRSLDMEINQENTAKYVKDAWNTRKEIGSNTSVPIVMQHEPRPVVIFRSKPIRGIVLELWSVR